MQFPFKEKMKNKKTSKNQNNMKNNGTQIIENRKESTSLSFSNQLATPQMIPQQMITPSPYQTRYTDDDKSRFESMSAENYASIVDFDDSADDPTDEKMIRQNDSLININVTQKRRKGKTQQKDMNLS